MPDTDSSNTPAPTTSGDAIKSWMMAILTLIFVLLYAGAFLGWIKTDNAIKDLQPIIFVVIGYYFGRLPSQQIENSLKEQINQQAGKADKATGEKENALNENIAMKEKMKNVKAVLASVKVDSSNGPDGSNGAPDLNGVKTAISILNA